MVKNSNDVTALLFAAFAMDCLPDMCNVSLGKKELVLIFQKSKLSIIFCDVEFYNLVRESLKEAKNNAKIFTLNGSKDDSEPVEVLFEKTGTENSFM